MADWTSTTTTTLQPEWMRSTTRDRLAACRAAHAPSVDVAGVVHPGERILPPSMSDFRCPPELAEALGRARDRAVAKRAPWWWPFSRRTTHVS